MSTSTSTLLLSLSVLFLLDIATIVQPVHGLKCYSQTFNGTDEGDRVEEICQNDDKYCVDFGGSLSLIGNMTVAFRSCEKTLTKHLQPLIDIIGKIPEVECKVSHTWVENMQNLWILHHNIELLFSNYAKICWKTFQKYKTF